MSYLSDYANNAARIYAEKARIDAEAQRQRGAIIGGTIASLGRLPEQILADRREGQKFALEQQRESRLATEADQNAQIGAFKLKEAQQADARNDAVREALKNAKSPFEAAEAIRPFDPERADKLQSANDEQAGKLLGRATKDNWSGIVSAFPKFAGPQDLPAEYPGDAWRDKTMASFITLKDQAAQNIRQQTLASQDAARKSQDEARKAEEANKAADNARLDAAAKEIARHNQAMETTAQYRATHPASAAAPAAVNDVQAAVQGMKEGTIPPQLPGRASKEYLALLAEAKRQGYDLASAATDWTATQKHIATLNGAQQTRMAQSIDNAAHSLDVIDGLANQWDGGKFPLLNKASLAAAKQGAMGPQAQKIAVQLEAQIADVTSELGNVYMGGNSPTDHALDLAAKNLSADWSRDTLKSMTALARKNLQIRQNSMRNVGVAGASPDNPYAPPQQTAQPKPTGRFNPATGKVEPIQ